MKTNKLVFTAAISIAIFAGYVSFYFFQINDTPEIDNKSKIVKPTEQKKVIIVPVEKKISKNIQKIKHIPNLVSEYGTENNPEPYESIETVASIKEKIYDIAVEYTDDLPLLDDIIQDSANEPLELWEGDWVSVDDWKRNNDAFSIEKNEDGSFELIPGRDSAHSYSYNEETKEFTWELDYYGKIITNKARFISEDVMVLMKISGIKVALDIYKRDAG